MAGFSEPNAMPMLADVAGVPGVASFYWENLEGLRAATLFMTDPGDAEARRIARERGLTHILIHETPEPAKFHQHVRFGDSDLSQARESLAGRLSRRLPPPWLPLHEE